MNITQQIKFQPIACTYITNEALQRKKRLITTYHHGEHRIGRLKTVRTFFPQITIPLNGDDIATNSISSLGDHKIGDTISVFGRKSLSDAEAADATTNDYTVNGGEVSGAGICFGRRCGGFGFLGNGTTENRVPVIAKEFGFRIG